MATRREACTAAYRKRPAEITHQCEAYDPSVTTRALLRPSGRSGRQGGRGKTFVKKSRFF